MRSTVLSLCVLLAGCSGKSEPKQASSGEELTGTWVVESVVPKESPVEKNDRLTFKGGVVTVQEGGKPRETKYQINPSKSPKEIDLEEKRRKAPGIYKVEGDTLWLCWDAGEGRQRPKEFKAEPHSNAVLLKAKREKK